MAAVAVLEGVASLGVAPLACRRCCPMTRPQREQLVVEILWLKRVAIAFCNAAICSYRQPFWESMQQIMSYLHRIKVCMGSACVTTGYPKHRLVSLVLPKSLSSRVVVVVVVARVIAAVVVTLIVAVVVVAALQGVFVMSYRIIRVGRPMRSRLRSAYVQGTDLYVQCYPYASATGVG